MDPSSDDVQRNRPPSPEGLAALLDEYVSAFQSGDPQRRRELELRHPELVEWAGCLVDLERVARLGEDEVSEATGVPEPAGCEPTVIVRGGAGGPQISPLVARSPPEPLDATELEVTGLDVTEPDLGPVAFGKFELRGELGRGGMGVVYRAFQADLGRMVALKVLTAAEYASPTQRRRFLQEARLASRLRHPHIVVVHEVGELQGRPYFTMELIEGTSLATATREGLDRAVAWMVAIADAVEHLHQNGVLHRDLKPSNILLDQQGRPYLTDFGLAKGVQDETDPTTTGTILGTPSYMAPEQAAGRIHEVDSRSDVYSLGAILYELLAGRPPFRTESAWDTLLLVLERDPLPVRHWNPGVPVALEQICLRCLEKNRERRYGSAREFAEDLARWSRGERTASASPSPLLRAIRWVRRYPSAAYRLLALVPCVLVILARCVQEPQYWGYYTPVLIGMGGWSVLSLLWERLGLVDRWAKIAPYGFVVTDLVTLTAVLRLVEGQDQPTLIAYALLILVAGLWLDRTLTWVAGLGSVAGYGVLLATSSEVPFWHIPLIVVVLLLCCAGATDFQIRRLSIWLRREHREAERPGWSETERPI